LNDTVKTPEELTELLNVPVLGTIARFGKTDDSYEKRLVTHRDPLSTVSEAYRAVRTNLLFSTNKRKNQFLVSSPGPVEGKSVTAANLAVVMASTGMRVLLIDADLRRPKVHEFFGLPNKVGLTTLLYADSGSVSSASTLDEMPPEVRQCIQDTPIQGLRVITSGFKPANPTEILGSTLAQHWFETFQNIKDIDAIVIDSPPTLVVADSYVLASAVKASIILVVQAGNTRRGAVLKAKEQFDQLEIEVIGTVLNSFDPGEWGYGYGYYSYYYYSQDGKAANRQGWRRFLPHRDRER
jgi:capsular exopolysaccharide synthesis family protein